MRRHVLFVALPAMLVGLSASDDASHHWSYSGESGPTHWSGICHSGLTQSPIDIRSKAAASKGLPPLGFSYHPTPLHIIDNGHSVQVDVPGGGNMLSAAGAHSALVQFHFHDPSEEAIDGKHAPMVIHMVHRDPKGSLAVVAVLVREGAANHTLETLWGHLPQRKEVEEAPAGVVVDPSGLLPKSHGYFTFVGSLTTPPCTEHVRWFVLKTPITASAAQIAKFRALYPGNARPVQPLNGREIASGG